MKKSLYIILFLIPATCTFLAQGQKPYSLEITASIPTEEKIVNHLKYEKEFENKSHQKEEIQKVLFYFYDNGYLTARFDSI
ncbi:MAG: hypothetical protein IMY70_03900, partial [Bacteroidetes bacterium]|nr:hypothetical protein [Bacteroidota bacterium]